MRGRTRREFLEDVGTGMLTAGLGVGLAGALGIDAAWAEAETPSLSFGSLEPLVELMQETPPDALMPLLVNKLQSGTQLRQLVAAGALANARTFGGEDYIGFHAFMAMAPSYAMAREMPAERRALPVLKVLYRSSAQLQAKGGRRRKCCTRWRVPTFPRRNCRRKGCGNMSAPAMLTKRNRPSPRWPGNRRAERSMRS